jgi:inorganic pyrophosphatase
MQNKAVGLGTLDAKIIFYIRNCPLFAHYQNLTSVKALVVDEIADTARETDNHW